jgi:hypothetical protein
VNLTRFIHEQGSADPHGLGRPSQQIPARNEKVSARQNGKVLGRKRVDDRSYACPVHLAHAHRTRLATGVEDASSNLIRRERPDRGGNHVRFGVSRWITIGRDSVLRGQDDVSVKHEERGKRMVSRAAGLTRQIDRLSYKGFIDIVGSHYLLGSEPQS